MNKHESRHCISDIIIIPQKYFFVKCFFTIFYLFGFYIVFQDVKLNFIFIINYIP